MLKILLYKWIFPKLLESSCESRIPRSGEEGKKVNCYVVALDRDSSPCFLATKYEDKILHGLAWSGNKYETPQTMSLSSIEKGSLNITHYYGLSEVTYNSIYDFVWHYITKVVYIKIHLYRYFDATHQYFFNKRKLVTKKRLDLLQFMLNDQLDRTHNGIGIIDLMTKLYSIQWVLHPSADEQQEKLELYLESLVSTGDLDKINDEYVVTGKAINTIEGYEEQERKHTEAVKLQKKMFWLTVFLAIVAVVQAGVIKLPIILDLSDSQVSEESHDSKIQPAQKPRD